MEELRFQCPACGSKLRIPRKYAGQKKHCPATACRAIINIPPGNESTGGVLPVKSSLNSATPASKVSAKTLPELKPAIPAQQSADKRQRKPAAETTQPTRLQKLPPLKKSAHQQKTVKTPKKHKPNLLSIRTLLIFGSVLGLVGIGTILLPSGNTGGVTANTETVQAESSVSYTQNILPFFKQYCYDCHSDGLEEGGISLDSYQSQPDFLADHNMWQKVYQQISVGSMPPQEADHPAPEERAEVAAWLDQAINHFNCQDVHLPGKVTVHRLNRNEYDNTIRDLLGVNLKLSHKFPSDDVGYGFDNIGDVLSVSPLLMEKYLDAAEAAVAAAIILPENLQLNQQWQPKEFHFEGSGAADEDQAVFPSTGSGQVTIVIATAGEYELNVQVAGTQAGDELAKCQIAGPGSYQKVHEIPGHMEFQTLSWKVNLPAGKSTVKISFLNDFYDPEARDRKRRDRNLFVRKLQLNGPRELTPESYPAHHHQLVTDVPDKNLTDQQAARRVLEKFVPRAFRRPARPSEIDRLMTIFRLARQRDESYERSLQIAIQAVLVSPQFLFRLEEATKQGSAAEIFKLGDYELASRLSYFLWSSMPDQELFDLAEQGLLAQQAILEQQVQRMLDDPKSEAFIRNFIGQWLGLRKLDEIDPNTDLFPEFTAELKEQMPEETILLFNNLVAENRSLVEFVTADYTFINDTLARLYGIADVTGKQFRKVSLQNQPRRGMISHAGILTLTSFPNRTSPVKRGEWVLENVLAQAPPPAPAEVPGLEETQAANPGLSFREQLVLHQSDPICSSCHKLMDGIGFGLQNYDAIGRWRTSEGIHPIDSRGTLPDGTDFNGPLELIQILGNQPEEITRCMTEKMLTYALGRGLEWFDRCTVDDIINDVRSDGFRMRSLITGIVLSPPFLNQQQVN